GENFLAHARDLLRRSNQAAQAMAAFAKPATATLKVGYIAPMLASLLTPALREFRRKMPGVEVVLCEMTPGEQLKTLREGRLDLALPGNTCPELDREFEVVVLRRIPLQAVLPDDHRLAQRRQVSLAELKDETFIGFDEDQFPGRNDMICRACQQAGFTPRLRHRVESLSALLAIVAAGNGVTLTPAEVGQLPHPGAVLVSLRRPVPSVASAAVFRKGEPRPSLVELMASPRRSAEELCPSTQAQALRVRVLPITTGPGALPTFPQCGGLLFFCHA